jgi:regulatory protein
LTEEITFHKCLEAAYRYLSYRPRSEQEVKLRLKKHGFDRQLIEAVVVRLKEQNLVDDSAFARFWKDSRLSSKPRSKRLIRRELRAKGVAAETVEQVTDDIDDAVNAYRLGRKRVPALLGLDYPDFYRRLSGYLVYRGFPHEIIKRIIPALWQEKEQR